jgi:general secretion pathway protein G
MGARTRSIVRTSRQGGFTLLEVMVVLALIALISSTIGVAVYRRWRDGQIRTTQVQVHEVAGRVAQFVIMKNRCPAADDLVNEHYLAGPLRDPWGTALTIRCPGEHEQDAADVVSAGPDQAAGTSDDIKSWER